MRLLLASLLLTCSATLAAQESAPPTFEQQSKTLEEEIARAGRVDQKHPDFLAAQLDYAQLLARNTAEENCATRLPEAESHLKIARDSVVTPLVLTGARGRIPVVGYYVEMARSRCATDAAQKTAALNAALKLARDAVAGYRGVFMYEPMTIMQFNVAQTHLDLGDKTQALKELQAAIELDRMYGLKADAAENFRTLNLWQDKQVTDEEVTAFTAAFQPASVQLKFGWKPTKVESNATSLPMTGTIKAEKDLFVYEVKVGEPKLDSSALGSEVEKKLVGLMARVLAKLPAAEIGPTGDFKGARDIEAFAKGMNAEIDKAVTEAVPANDPRLPGIKAAMDQELRPYAAADNLLGKIQQGYSLETGIWTDATLEQNAWVSLPLTLSMNGTPQGFIEHTVEAVFSRRVPCAPGLPAGGCVELLLDAVPTAKAIDDVAAKLDAANQGKLDYAAATRMRLVVDPVTLVPYENETLRYTYLALGNKNQRAVKIASEASLATYRYRK
jgi:tetratricopeptide (TPR) repeat protein